MSLPFNNFNVNPSCRTSNPTNYPKNLYPHKPCLGCSGDCLHWGQFTNFSSQGFESHSNSYTPNRNNHSDFLWQAHATGNYSPQVDELHHPEYPQFDNQFSTPSSYGYPPKLSSLEYTLKAFIQSNTQIIQELKDATMVNSQSMYKIKDATMVSS
jgi:hypothetical protein